MTRTSRTCFEVAKYTMNTPMISELRSQVTMVQVPVTTFIRPKRMSTQQTTMANGRPTRILLAKSMMATL